MLLKPVVEAQASITNNDFFTASCALGYNLPPLTGLGSESLIGQTS